MSMGEPTIEGYQYCMGLKRAFESLISDDIGHISVHVNEVSNGELSNLTKSRISLETSILRNHTGKKGFLMWI